MVSTRDVLRTIVWDGAMKYFTIAWIVIMIHMLIVYHLVSPAVAIVMGVGLMLLAQYAVHSYWMYLKMRDDDEFEYNPVAGALVGTTLMYIVSFAAGMLLIAFWAAISMMTGYPLTLPGVFGTWLAYLLYVRWR